MELTEIARKGNYVIIALKGSMDIGGVQAVEMNFLNEINSSGNVIVDVSGVDFIASLGMRMILGAVKKMALNNRKLVLVNPQPLVDNALDVAGLKSVIDIVGDLDTACQLIQ